MKIILKQNNMRYCFKCYKIKPNRAHHCVICNYCVLKMDHHCPFLSICIGYKNYKIFINFVINLNIILFIINYQQINEFAF